MTGAVVVYGPLVTACLAAGLFARSVWKLDRRAGAPLEIGTLYAAIVALYVVIPLAAYLARGMTFTILNENRLFGADPIPEEIGLVGWWHVAHLCAFCLAYRALRGRDPSAAAGPPPSRLRLLVALSLYALVTAYLVLIGRLFDLSAADYEESYVVLRRLPLLLAQATVHLDGIRLTLELVLLCLLFGDYRRYRPILFAAYALVAAATILRLGSRTEFVVLSAAYLLLYHQRVRPVSLARMALLGLAAMAFFQAAGTLRGHVLEYDSDVWRRPFEYNNEFEAVFANAFDLWRLRESGAIGRLPLGFYLVDLLAFVPQQISPIAKVSPSDWYIQTYYPIAASGGSGYAFGTIAESILGGGWLDLLLRGALLGALAARLHHWCVRRRTFWPGLVYLWASVQIYHAFRNTTFCLLGLFVYRVLPVVLAIELGLTVFSGAPRRAAGEVARG